MRVALVGAGTVGSAVAHLLSQKGHDIVGVSSRNPETASRAADRLGTNIFAAGELPEADVVLVGASDTAIEDVAAAIVERVSEGSFVCHFAGSFGPSVLQPVISKGAHACAIHPVQACPTFEAAVARLPGSAWGVTCSDPASNGRMAELIEADLDGYPVVLSEDVRSIWHAAAVTTSNGMAALLAAGEDMLADIGIDDPVRVLGPLAAGTIQNAREGGGGAATLTGPVVRGEKETVRRHVAALTERPGAQFEQYRAAAFLIVQAAVASGRIDEKTAEEIIREFGS